MRQLFFAALASVLLSTSSGCLLPLYSGDPPRRTRQLVFTAENLRLLLDEWERFWMLEQPDHMTPWRTHGGII